MSLHSLFIRFHTAIQLTHYDENKELREKRERVLTRLRSNLAKTFESFNQGSYAMGTGIKPLNGDYDIDIGIVLNDVYYTDHEPVAVKRWVYEAVKEHTAHVDWRRPCITVYYSQGGEPVYHVDLTVFARDRYSERLRLAMGKEHSAQGQCEWQLDDRKGFIEEVKNRFSGEDGAQFRRIVRYLKRWKDLHIPSLVHAAPIGLCLTVATYHWFQPTRGRNGGYDDLAAAFSLVQAISQQFSGSYLSRLRLVFPRDPRDDLFARMNDQQMGELRQGLEKLARWLAEAQQTNNSAPLVKAFGSDFPAQ